MNCPENCRDCEWNGVGYEHARYCNVFDFYLWDGLETTNCEEKVKVRIG